MDFSKASPEGRDDRECVLCNRWYYVKVRFLQGFTEGKQKIVCATRILRHRLVVIKKFWISEKLHRREETAGSVCYADAPSSFSYYKKSLDFSKASPGERNRECVLSMGAQSCWCYNRWMSAPG